SADAKHRGRGALAPKMQSLADEIILALSECQVFVVSGGALESWFVGTPAERRNNAGSGWSTIAAELVRSGQFAGLSAMRPMLDALATHFGDSASTTSPL